MSTSTVDTASANPEMEWPSTIQQAGKAVALLNSIETLARDEKEYAKFLSRIVDLLRARLERAANARAATQLESDISRLEDYRKTADSFLLQLVSKLDPEGSYGRSGVTAPTPSWQLTSEDVTHFVRLSDQLDQEWDNWRSYVHVRE